MLQILQNYNIFFFFLFFFPFLSFSDDFNITEVDENIFVHFGKQEDSSKDNKGDIANIGFIIGEKSVLVIDTGGTSEIAEKLISKIHSKTDLPISHVVITHGHPDHFLGSSAFSKFNPIFIGHENLKRSLSMNFNFYKALQARNIEQESILEIKPVLPSLSIKKNTSYEVNLGNRKINITAWESGHTDNDLSVLDLKTKILWTENIFVERTPSIRASILGWKKNLEETIKMDLNKIIPGHGPVLDKNQAIEPMMNYFNRLLNETRAHHKSGGDIESAQKQIGSGNEENWLLFEEYHKSNVTKVYSELEWE